MAENNTNQTNSGFTSNIGEENSLGFGTPPSGGPGFTPFTPPAPPTPGPGVGIPEGGINDIVVSVSDPAPVVVLFGPAASGKTMTLVRLTLYLEKMGYQIIPINTFRPAYDEHYKRICNEYSKLCHSKYAPGGNEAISFMLVKVLDKIGRPICQLLEAPGEHYFDPTDPKMQFPTYITNIMQLTNKRVWMFIVEQDWGRDQEMRDMYVQRIINMPANLRRDKSIFVCHKVDKHPEVFLGNGKPNTNQIFKNIKNQYPGIFTPFVNRNPITKLFRKYNFKFVPFSAGAFTPTDNGRQVYIPGEDVYPKLLWKAILKTVKG